MERVSTATTTSPATIMGVIICTLGAIFYCYEYLLRIQPSVMVPELMRQFNVSAQYFSTTVSLYYLAYTPMQAVVGVMNDLYGPRNILTFAVFICAIGSMLFGFADSIYLASIGRFLVGFGSSFAFVSALKLAAIWLPMNRFASYAGLVTALGMVGGMVGDVGLTHLVAAVGAKATIYASTLLGFLLTPVIWYVIREKHPSSKSRLNSKAAYKETFAGLLVILRNPQTWLAGIIGSILYLSLSIFAELWGIPFLKTTHNLDANQAALANSFLFLGWLLGAPLTGWISDKMRKRRIPLMFGCIFSAITIAIIIYVPLTILQLKFLLFLFGVFSSIEVVCFALGREKNPSQVSGAAVSFINLIVMLSGLIFQPLVGKILDLHWSGKMGQGIRIYDASTYQLALSVIPIAILVGVGLTFLLREPSEQQV